MLVKPPSHHLSNWNCPPTRRWEEREDAPRGRSRGDCLGSFSPAQRPPHLGQGSREDPLLQDENRKSRPGGAQDRKSRLWTGEGHPEAPRATPDPADMVHGQGEDPSGSGGWRTRLSRICLGSDTTMPTGDPFPALRVASPGDLCPLIYAGHSPPRSRSPSQRPSPRDGQILPTPRFTTPPPLTCPEPAWPARRRRRPQKTWRDLASLPRGWPLPTASPRLPDPSRPRPRWRPRGFPGPPRGKGDSRAPIRKMVERKASACSETSLDHQDLPLRNMAVHTRPLRTTVN